MKSKPYILTFGLLVSTFFSSHLVPAALAQQAAQSQPVGDNEYQVSAILFMQKAAEYRALAYQAFNAAEMRLNEDFDKKSLKKLPKAERKKPRAVVVDVDETVLDNSPNQAFLVKNRQPFNLNTWYAWGELRRAKAIPGAVDFLNAAHRKGVRVFYVSNRDEVQKRATMDNLKSAGFPAVSADTVLLRIKDSTKEPRRDSIEKKYRIVLLVGDNLDDFSDVFERKSVADRFAEVDRLREFFGRRFIVLPNPMYGTWESAIYEYQRLNEAEKAKKRLELLESFDDTVEKNP